MKQEIEKLNDVIRDFIVDVKSNFAEVKFISSEIIKMLEKADIDEEILKIENQLTALKKIQEKLK